MLLVMLGITVILESDYINTMYCHYSNSIVIGIFYEFLLQCAVIHS